MSRAREEVDKPKTLRNDIETTAVAIGLSAFVLSIFLIYWGMVILVRFYIFDHILYNIFILCILTTGIIVNVASLNLLLTHEIETSCVRPFVIGFPVTIFWTVLSICFGFLKDNFFSQFAFMPIALYDSAYYDGLGFNPNNTALHPFAKPFVIENSFFEQTTLVFSILTVFAIAQLLCWTHSIFFYRQLEVKSVNSAKLMVGTSKDL